MPCFAGTLEPATTDARLLTSFQRSFKGPILKAVIKQKLYRCLTETLTSFQDVLSLNLKEIAEECNSEFRMRNVESPVSDDGCFTSLPREIILYIFGFLDFQSLARCANVSRLFRNISYDSSLYNIVSLRSLFDKVNDETFKYLYNRIESLHMLGECLILPSASSDCPFYDRFVLVWQLWTDISENHRELHRLTVFESGQTQCQQLSRIHQ